MIKIANIYYDLLNLYGDTGNCKALAYHLRETGEEVSVDNIRFGDNINFNEYNLIFIGSGTENNLKLALEDILKYKDDANIFGAIVNYVFQGVNSTKNKDVEKIGNNILSTLGRYDKEKKTTFSISRAQTSLLVCRGEKTTVAKKPTFSIIVYNRNWYRY